MEQIVHADIFFFITSIAVVVVGCATLVFICFLISFMREARKAVRTVRRMTEKLEADVDILRENVKDQGHKVRTIFEILVALAGRPFARPQTRRKKTEKEKEVV